MTAAWLMVAMQVCSNAAKVDLLSPENLQAQADGHSTLRKRLRELLVEHADFNRNSRPPATTDGDQEASATSVSCEESTRVAVDLPIHNLVFTGSELKVCLPNVHRIALTHFTGPLIRLHPEVDVCFGLVVRPLMVCLQIIDLSEYAQDVVPAFCSQMGSSL